jgi:hypothetical protein
MNPCTKRTAALTTHALTHAVGSQISQSKDSGSIGNNNHVHITVGPVVDHCRHVTTILFREVHTARPTKARCKLGTGLTHGGCVNERSHLFNVVNLRCKASSRVRLGVLQVVFRMKIWRKNKTRNTHQHTMIKSFVSIVQVL